MFLKKNKYIILSFIIMFIVVVLSFYQYYDENFSYAKDYYIIKENCYEGKNINHEYCSIFNKYGEEYLESYLSNSDPVKKYEELDAITLTCNIVELTVFNVLQFFSPLLIFIALIGTIHSLFSSGMFKNYLLRMDYKNFIKKFIPTIIKISLITPIALIFIFIVSMLITKFNFTPPEEVELYAVYDAWKYQHFLLYGTIICAIQFLINILYCNIGLYCCKKNKNSLVAIMLSYIGFILVDMFIYIIVYVLVINKILGFSNLTDYFNITGYWFFDSGTSCVGVLLIAFIIQLISTIFIYKCYSCKEEVIISYEKQNA